MRPLIEKYMNTERIRELIIREKYDTIAEEEYIRFLDDVVRDAEKDNDFREGYEDEFMNFTKGYIDSFLAEREKGFGVEWSRLIAGYVISMNDHAIANAYLSVSAIDHEQAHEDLILYAKIKNLDNLFIKHFEFLLKVDSPTQEPTVEEQAVNYSEIYKKQISEGTSERFANHYAYLKAKGEYSELGCFAEAAEYEKAILAGYNESDGHSFAMKMSEYIANHFFTYEESFGDTLANLERERLEKMYGPLNRI